MQIIQYSFENHIKKCQNQIIECKKEFSKMEGYLGRESLGYIEKFQNFLNSIDTNIYKDFNEFNNQVKILNDELNIRMKSISMPSLALVVANVDESDYYTYKQFISPFHYDQNLLKNASEEYLKLLKTLDKMIEKIPEDFEAYKERADLKVKLGLYTEAIEDYEYALKLNNDYDEAKRSLEELNKKLENINNSTIHYEDAVKYFEEKNYEKALECINKSIEIDNTKSKYYSFRGRIKNELKMYNDIIEDANKAIELDKNNKESYYCRGVAKDNLGEYAEAIKDYDKAIELDHNDPVYYYNRGCAKHDLGEYLEAIKDYDKAIELNPNDPVYYYNRGCAKHDLGKYRDAVNDYNKAVELDPNYSKAHCNRRIALKKLGFPFIYF